jgi:nucleotide-binding universal stress UspA family protein
MDQKIDRILVPVDFSAWSHEALGFAVLLAARFGASLDILYVSDRPVVRTGPLDPGEEDLRRRGREMVDDELGRLRGEGQIGNDTRVELSARILEGGAAEVILREAGTGRYDLVAMGTRGRTGLGRLMGSVAAAVVRQAPCPVLTARIAAEHGQAPP